MYKTLEQLKKDRNSFSLARLIMYLIGQHWRLDATIYFAEMGYAIPFAKEMAFKIKNKKEFLELYSK